MRRGLGTRRQKLEHLASVGLFAGYRRSELASIARIAYEHQVPEGTVLVTEGVFPSWVMSRGSREEAASEFSSSCRVGRFPQRRRGRPLSLVRAVLRVYGAA